MLQSISWSNYLTAVVVLVVLWYAVVIFIYFRKEASKLISGKYTLPFGKKDVSRDEDLTTTKTEHTFEELEGIVTDIRHNILEEAGKEVSKEQLLSQLSDRLANYGGLRQPAFRMAINNFIIQHAESICGAAFSEEELDDAWEALPR